MSDQKSPVGFAGLSSLVSQIEENSDPSDKPKLNNGPEPVRAKPEIGDQRENIKSGETRIGNEANGQKPTSKPDASSPKSNLSTVAGIGAFAAVGIIIIWGIVNNGQQAPHSTSMQPPSPAAVTGTKPEIPSTTTPRAVLPAPRSVPPPETFVQVAPTPGDSDRILSQENIRWCLYQGRRIEIIRTLIANVKSDEDVTNFNSLTDDFNSRCSKYRYRKPDMAVVREELKSKELELKSQAERVVEKWPHRELAPANTAPTYNEVAPLVGDGTRILDKENIRWCLYQKDRIEKIRRIISAVQNNDYVDNFNALTHDYNSRCGSYRYRENDLLTVQSELVLHDTELRSQASALVGQWADQSAKRSTSPPTITGQPLALGYPNASRSAANSAVQPDPERDAAGTRAPAAPTLDLLKVEDATEVQRRLAELGFYVGIPNGIWGARSRQALGEFKSENGLPRDDSWDIATNNKLLSSNVQKRDSGRTSTDLLGLTPAAETKYPPPIGAVRNPLNVEDAKIVQKILVELGFLTGTQDGVWGPVSRNALRDFKLKTGLAANDEWNAETERALENAAPKSDAIRIDETFIGGWAGEFSDCPNDSTGEAPLQITEHRAAIGDTVCNFAPPRREGSGWRTKAACIRPSRKPWNSNVKIEVAGDNLTWSSEGGTVKFVRCPGR